MRDYNELPAIGRAGQEMLDGKFQEREEEPLANVQSVQSCINYVSVAVAGVWKAVDDSVVLRDHKLKIHKEWQAEWKR